MGDITNKMEKIVAGIKEHADIVVLALSGGADSTLCLCLCEAALGKENVYTVGLPYGEIDRNYFNSLSRKIATHVGVPYADEGIAPIADNIISVSEKLLGFEVTNLLNKGNARARARMTVLYTMSHALGEKFPDKRVRVLNSCNRSENAIFYETKHGDGAGDLGPICYLFKAEVYKMLDVYRDMGVITEGMINRIPSAGLWKGQTDEDEMGITYDRLEVAIRFMEKNYTDFKRGTFRYDELSAKEIEDVKKVWKMHVSGEHKRSLLTTIEV